MMKTSCAALLLVAAAGCASTQGPPTDKLASSLAAVRGAEEAGAQNVPEAALHLKLAEEQIERAKNTEDPGRAEGLAVRAGEDAELALALAREQQAKERLARVTPRAETGGGEMPTAPSSNAVPHTETRTP